MEISTGRPSSTCCPASALPNVTSPDATPVRTVSRTPQPWSSSSFNRTSARWLSASSCAGSPAPAAARSPWPRAQARRSSSRDSRAKPRFASAYARSDGTANATKTAALDAAFCTPNPPGCPYTGLSGDVDGDGVLDYQRYWNVWTTSFDGSTTTGKFIQVIVRWKEPVLGYRQISVSTFKEIPNQLDTGL